MNWRQIYCNIIKNAKNEAKERELKRKNKEEYYERHHILPKSLYPQYNKNKRNLVLLTAREHWICHKIAVRIWPMKEMLFALWIITHDNRNNYCVKSSKEYENLKNNFSFMFSNFIKDLWQDEEYREKIVNAVTQKWKDDKWKKSFGNLMKNLWNNKEFKEKMQNIHNSIEYREKMRKNVWDKNLGNQYHLGHKHSEEIRKKISENRGSHSAWNKGLSGWWTEKMHEAMKNKKLSEETRKKMGIKPEGFEAWNKGKEHSIETKQKMSSTAKKRFEDPEERKKQAKNSGKSWYNNGIKNGFYFKCPEGWVKGRLKVNRPKGLKYKEK